MESPKIASKKPIVLDMAVGTNYWCACGRSSNQPFCDGSHQGSAFTPIEMEISEPRKVAWCACKHSGRKPFCDGTHAKL